MENKNPNQKPPKPSGKSPRMNLSWIYGIIIFILIGSYFFNESSYKKEVPFSTFENYIKNGFIENIDVYSNKGNIEARVIPRAVKTVFGNQSDAYAKERIVNVRIPADEFSKFYQKAKTEYNYKGGLNYRESRDYGEYVIYILPTLLLIGFLFYSMPITARTAV